ncbi:alpha/beta-hydrolase [Trichoderma compactum]
MRGVFLLGLLSLPCCSTAIELESGLPRTLTPIRHANTSTLSIAYYVRLGTGRLKRASSHLGPRLPYSIDTYVDVVLKLMAQGYRLIVPYMRGYGTTTFLSPTTTPPAPCSAEQAALGKDIEIFAGYDWGMVAVNAAAALWPGRCSGMVAANSYLMQNRQTAWGIASPASLANRWYFYVFLTLQGFSGLANDTRGWAETLWSKNSPRWNWTQAELDAAIATSFYRNRLLYAPGDPAYAQLADKLDSLPPIHAPSVTLDPDQAPDQPPQVFADAVIEVAALGKS